MMPFMLKGLLQQYSTNSDMIQMFSKLMAGKNKQEQIDALLESAKSKGFNVDEKIFSADDLRQMGLIINGEKK